MSETGLILALFSILFTLFTVLTERKLLAYDMRRRLTKEHKGD